MKSSFDGLANATILQPEEPSFANSAGAAGPATSGPEQRAFVTSAPASAGDRRLAFAAVALSALFFMAAIPFAKRQLPEMWAFIPAYQAALVACDLITAALLFGQARFSRSVPLLVLAAGYLFTAALAVAHALSFPGLFAPGGLLSGGRQSTAWLYMFWHGGFPLFVIAYVLLKRAAPLRSRWTFGDALGVGVSTVLATASALTWIAIAEESALPAIMQGNGYTAAMISVVSTVWLLSLLALVGLWRRPPYTVLDLWLMAVMCAWLFDIGLSAVFNAGRFDLGFYAGRIYGLLAASFVLTVLLLENSALHVRLALAHRELEDLYDRAPCGYHSVDKDGLIVRMNDTWLRWLGYSRDEVVGKLRHADLMTAESAERFWKDAFPLFKKQGWLKEIEFEYRRRDGTTFPGSLQTSAIYDAQGRYQRSRTAVFDISRTKEVERALRESEQRIRALVEGVQDYAILTLGPQGHVTSWNAGAELIKGYSAAEILGRHFSLFYPQDMIDAGWPQRELEFADQRGHFEDEGWRVRKDGSRFWANVVITAIRDESGRVCAYSKIARDLSERKRAEEAVRALNKELESFTYSVSHDLRAPLRAVDGYARMLEEDYAARLDDEGRRLLSVVRESSLRMGRLIDDLLAFSRLGRQEPAKQPIDMDALAREVADELRKGSHARVDICALPHARADRALIRQVWANLLGNAFKYSGKRPDARIEVGGREEAGDNLYWVRDNGVGFDMRYAGKLFGVFQRLHGAEEFPGTGVGLAIVQRVVTRHGGRVWAEGTPGEGACFQFSLPKEA